MAQLSTTSSIVDYLALQGKESGYPAREKLWNDLGLKDRIGTYTGSPTQNPILLNTLRSQAETQKSTSSFQLPDMGSLKVGGTPVFDSILKTPTATPSPYGMSTPTGPVYYNVPTTPTATGTLNSIKTASEPYKQPTATVPTPEPTAQTQPTQPTPEDQFGATDALAAINASATGVPSADEALKQVMESPAYKLYLEGIGLKSKAQQAEAETTKTALEQQAAQTAENINKSYGQRGLFFSGMRPDDLKQLADNLAVSKLGIDRDLANKLLETDIDLRSRILGDVESIIKDAVSSQEKTRTQALDQLNKAGFVLIGDQLLPTLEYRKLTQENSEYRNVSGVGLVKITGDQYEVVIPEVQKEEGLTYKQKVDLEVKLANDFEKYAKEARQAERSIGIIESSYNQAIKNFSDKESVNAASQGILVTFQKFLDPTSVVRESEYARSPSGQSLEARIRGAVNKLQFGGAGVTLEELKSFYDMSQQLLKVYEKAETDFASRVKQQSNSYGLNINNILTPSTQSLMSVENDQFVQDDGSVWEIDNEGYYVRIR